MSSETLWERVRMAWAMLAGRSDHDVKTGRERESPPPRRGDEPALPREGFAEEALPWLDAVYRLSLRLTAGDRDAAEDLVQDTFLRAYRSWQTFERGTNAKSWLFTICRNTHLNETRRPGRERERPAADFDAPLETFGDAALAQPPPNPEQDFFRHFIEEEVVSAIDGLPGPFREVLVLSDLGDLTYLEIARVLDIPVGTAKSRLFRARRMLQEQLKDFAVRSGRAQGEVR